MRKLLGSAIALAMLACVQPATAQERGTGSTKVRFVRALCTTGPCNPFYNFVAGSARIKKLKQPKLSSNTNMGRAVIVGISGDDPGIGVVQVRGTVFYGPDPGDGVCDFAGTSRSNVLIGRGFMNCPRMSTGLYRCRGIINYQRDDVTPPVCTDVDFTVQDMNVAFYPGGGPIDDFAHHPSAVAGTLAAVRHRYPQRRLWALFEPRSNTSRRAVFQRQYAGALAGADLVVVGGVFHKEADTVAREDLFSPWRVVGDLRAAGVTAWTLSASEEIASLVAARAHPGDVVVLMSNGDFQGLRGLLAAKLERRLS